MQNASLMRLSFFAFIAVAMSYGIANGGMFVTPIGGTPYEDWTIVNYLDLQSGSGRVDYRGGNYTYDGHDAIDFTLPNFAAMDAGVDVVAAGDGIVTAIRDGEYDRWSRVNPNPGQNANLVYIYHGDGIFTGYLHLKNGSVSVQPGDLVVAGQKLGEVGSSGNSTDAHLHFSVYENGEAVETYLDPDRWWIDPLPYSGDVAGSLDHGITNSVPTTADLVERPVDHDVYRQIDGPGQGVVLWAHLHGFSSGDDIDVYFYKPDGTEYFHSQETVGNIRYGWRLAATTLPDIPDLGEWQVDYQRNGTSLFTETFTVVVPEPTGFVLGTFGIAIIAGFAMRRRSRSRS